MRFKLQSLLLIFALLATTVNASAAPLCESLFQTPLTTAPREAARRIVIDEPERIGDSKELRYKPTGRVVELKEIKPTNQCRTSECYLFSFVNFLNQKISVRDDLPGGDMRISHPLLVANKFLQHIREGVWYGPDAPRTIHNLRGGFSYEALHLSREVGLAADESWQPKVPFEKWDTEQIYNELEKKVPEWHEHLQGLARREGTWESPIVRNAEKEAYEKLKHVILDHTGDLPKEFNFRGETMTPKAFEEKFGAPRNVRLLIDQTSDSMLPGKAKNVLNEAMVKNGNGGWRYQPRAVNDILQEAVRWIEADQPVIIDFDWNEGGHSMMIVGFEANNQGTIVRYKVMNSWGPNFGNDGYAWYTPEDMANNLRRTYKFGKLE